MSNKGLLSEKTITDRLRTLANIPRSSRVILGIGDDCAIYRPRASREDLLFTTDLFIEGIHFRRETHKNSEAGRKAINRSLSDIAAMGGDPRFCLVSLCAPKWAGPRWVDGFFDALTAAAAKAGAVLAGGDLSLGESMACDVMVCGVVPRGTALRRDGARAGDEIYVSGVLGGSALGLETRKGIAWKRHLNPEPRLALGQYLRAKLGASSAIDLSDGLSLDLRRVCLESGVAAEITEPPVFPGATLLQALHGGEDYELLFTVDPGRRVPADFGGIRLSRIGTIIKGPPGELRFQGKLVPALGYDHFSNEYSRSGAPDRSHGGFSPLEDALRGPEAGRFRSAGRRPARGA